MIKPKDLLYELERGERIEKDVRVFLGKMRHYGLTDFAVDYWVNLPPLPIMDRYLFEVSRPKVWYNGRDGFIDEVVIRPNPGPILVSSVVA